MSAPTTPGALVRTIREYLAVHPDLTLSGQAMDNMALDLARIAVNFRTASAEHGASAGWLPIETAPKDSTARLVWCPARQNTYAVTWLPKKGWLIFGGRLLSADEAPTYWRPMPIRPRESRPLGDVAAPIDRKRITQAVCQRVAELPDRNSPEDWPGAMLVTTPELWMIVAHEVQPATDDAALYRWIIEHASDALTIIEDWCMDGEATTDELHDALCRAAAQEPQK